MLDAPRIMDKLIGAGLIVIAAGAHNAARSEGPPEGVVKWANSFPLAALEWTAAHRGC